MKQTLLKSIAGAGLLIFSLTAGQALAQQDSDSWHRTRDEFYAGQNWKMKMFDRIRDDLDHVQTMAFSGGDEYRIVRTKQEIGELQGKMAAGRYDQPELDDVIANLERVLSDNRLSPTDRDMLSDDLNRIRDYKAHHEDWR